MENTGTGGNLSSKIKRTFAFLLAKKRILFYLYPNKGHAPYRSPISIEMIKPAEPASPEKVLQ
jgi:hypothetical protein